MTAAHPILAAYDGHATAPVVLGERLARLLGLPLHVATAYRYQPVALSARQVPRAENVRRSRAAEHGLERLLDRLGLDAERSSLPAQDVAEELVALAVARDAAAIVVGPDVRARVAWAVVRGARCPVAVAPRRARRLPRAVAVVGVAFDGSHASRLAVTAAARLAARAGARVELHAVGDEKLLATAESAAAELAPGAACVVHEGRPADALAEAARALDVLVCGSRGRGRLLGALLGSVSSALVDDPPRPVLVVPGPARRDASAPLGLTTAGAA
jgi:nucleotide-binding universal stress UspA family protein